MQTGMIASIITSLATRTPLMLVWLVALVFAIARWKKHPKVSMMVVIAITILWLETMIGSFLSVYLPYYVIQSGRPRTEVSVVYGIYGVATNIVAAGCWGLLIAAIFGGRDEATSPR